MNIPSGKKTLRKDTWKLCNTPPIRHVSGTFCNTDVFGRFSHQKSPAQWRNDLAISLWLPYSCRWLRTLVSHRSKGSSACGILFNVWTSRHDKIHEKPVKDHSNKWHNISHTSFWIFKKKMACNSGWCTKCQNPKTRLAQFPPGNVLRTSNGSAETGIFFPKYCILSWAVKRCEKARNLNPPKAKASTSCSLHTSFMKNLCFRFPVPKQCCQLGQLLLCPNTTPHLEGKYRTSTIYDHSTCQVSTCHQLSSFMIFMYLSRLGSKQILTCITQYPGHLPRVFIFKTPPPKKKRRGGFHGNKNPRSTKGRRANWKVFRYWSGRGSWDQRIWSPPEAPKQHRSVDPFFPKLRNWEAFFGRGGRFKQIYEPPWWWDFLRWGFFSSLGTTCWCCQRGVVGPFFPVRWRSRPGHFTRSAGAITVLATAPEKRNFANDEIRWSRNPKANHCWDGTKKTLIKKRFDLLQNINWWNNSHQHYDGMDCKTWLGF